MAVALLGMVGIIIGQKYHLFTVILGVLLLMTTEDKDDNHLTPQ